MSPTAAVRDFLHLVVSCVAICDQASGKAFEEALRAFTAPVRLVLKNSDMVLAVLSAGIEPHSGFRSSRFLVMSVILCGAPVDEPVYKFMDRKRAEGKPYKVYMMASANKFLRIYYATVKAHLDALVEA